MQSLRAVLWNSGPEKKVGTYHVSSKTSVVESFMIKSFGNALLKAIGKNSYAENSLKKIPHEISFLEMPPATLRFSLFWLYPSC